MSALHLYKIDDKTIFPLIDMANDDLTPFGYISIEVPQDEEARLRLFSHGDYSGCIRHPRTKEEYDAEQAS